MSRSDNPLPDPSVQALVDELSRLSAPDGAVLLAGVPAAKIPELLRLTRPALAEELLMALSEERRQAVLAAAPLELGRQWEKNLTYPEESVGRLMEPPLVVFAPTLTVAETTSRIRELVKTTFVSYGFVTDESGVLLG